MAGRMFLKATVMMRNLIVTYLIIRVARTNKAKGFARGDVAFGFPISADNGLAGTGSFGLREA